MFKFVNLHPKGLFVGDCVVRAISCAENKDYLETRRKLNALKRQWNKPSYTSTVFIRKYLKDCNYISFQAEAGQTRMTGGMFCITHPEGTYLLKMAHHLTCCKDGVIYDTWDCSDKCVYCAWEVK